MPKSRMLTMWAWGEIPVVPLTGWLTVELLDEYRRLQDKIIENRETLPVESYHPEICDYFNITLYKRQDLIMAELEERGREA